MERLRQVEAVKRLVFGAPVDEGSPKITEAVAPVSKDAASASNESVASPACNKQALNKRIVTRNSAFLNVPHCLFVPFLCMDLRHGVRA